MGSWITLGLAKETTHDVPNYPQRSRGFGLELTVWHNKIL
jgi:hypothetical protein